MNAIARVLGTMLLTWLIAVFSLGLPMLAFVCAVMIDLIRPLTAHAATTYYIATNGNDTTGTGSISQPWLTWSKANSVMVCGDTLLYRNGTYPVVTHGAVTITSRNCTVSTGMTVRAENERQAHLQGNGNPNSVVTIVSSHYITISGLWVSSADNSAVSGGGFAVVDVRGATNFSSPSSNIKILNNIISNNNRYQNCMLMVFTATNDSLAEGNEFYNFHRHALVVSANSLRVVSRRNYANSRTWAEIPGGFDAGPGTQTRGSDAFLTYTTGGTIPTTGNIYENNISEKNGKGFGMESISEIIGFRFLGNISLDDTYGIVPKARPEQDHQPVDTIIKDNVVIRAEAVGVYLRGNRNTQITNLTVLNSVSNSGLISDVEGCSTGFCFDGTANNTGTVSFFASNLLLNGNAARGIHVVESHANPAGVVDDWLVTNANTYNNVSANSPATSAKYVAPSPPSVTIPGLGDCMVFRPDGSAAKTNGWGADVLYRYQDGILTNVPLWDPTTGEFPHGAIAVGINDTVGTSAFDVHKRLNVPYPGDTHGCNFPASYAAGTPPTGGASSGFGTTSTTHNQVVEVGVDSLTACLALFDAGGNVGSGSSVTSGGEALSLLKRQVSSPAYRASELWGKINPASGNPRSIVASTSGDVDAMVTTTKTIDNISSYDNVAGTTERSATPSVTVQTGAGETLVDCLSAYSGTTLTAGQFQTLVLDTAHDTIAQRGAMSTQSGTDGDLMSHLLGTSSSWWTTATVALCPTAGCAVTTNELAVTKYGIFSGFGTEAGSGALAATNAAASIAPTGMARVRAEITASVATTPPFGFSLYCQKVSEGVYRQITNDFGSSIVRLYGGGVDPYLPSSLEPTTPRLTAADANSVAGVMFRDATSAWVAPQMASGKRIEMEWVVIANASAGDVIQCQPRFDSGVSLTANTVTATLNIIAPGSSGAF